MGWHEDNARYSYTNALGQDVYYVAGANVYPAPVGLLKRFLVIHHTAGTDSRAYLKRNPKRVSTHYLIGNYDDGRARRVYKYASEVRECTHTQGFGTIGGYTAGNINDVCISIEIEGPPIDDPLMLAAADLARSIIDTWRGLGVELLMLRHKDIDTQKSDPALQWNNFCQLTYRLRV